MNKNFLLICVAVDSQKYLSHNNNECIKPRLSLNMLIVRN